MIDWTLTASFLAVAETGSLSEAARRLGHSQPTLGRHIKALEHNLGIELFTRHTRGFTLTQQGAKLVPAAQDMRAAMERLRLTAAGQEEALRGTVRITASILISHTLLPPIIADLRHRYPEIQIELVPTDTTENLLFREADIALRMYRPTQADVITRKIGDLALGIYAADSYLARKGRPETFDDLKEHDFVGYDRSTLLMDGMREMGINARRDSFPVRCDNQATYWELVKAGCGLGVTQCILGDSTPGISRVGETILLKSLPIWLTAPAILRSSRRIRVVFDHLATALP